MNSDLLLGLQISLTGLTVTFLSLGMLIFVIRLLRWIFPADRVVRVERRARQKPPPEESEEQRKEETAVALAVGVSLLEKAEHQADRDPTLGKLLEP